MQLRRRQRLLNIHMQTFQTQHSSHHMRLILTRSHGHSIQYGTKFNHHKHSDNTLFSRGVPRLNTNKARVTTKSRSTTLTTQNNPLTKVNHSQHSHTIMVSARRIRATNIIITRCKLNNNHVNPDIQRLEHSFKHTLRRNRRVLINRNRRHTRIPTDQHRQTTIRYRAINIHNRVIRQTRRAAVQHMNKHTIGRISPLLIHILLGRTHNARHNPVHLSHRLGRLVTNLTTILRRRRQVITTAPIRNNRVLMHLTVPVRVNITNSTYMPIILVRHRHSRNRVRINVTNRHTQMATTNIQLLKIDQVTSIPNQLINNIRKLRRRILQVQNPPRTIMSIRLLTNRRLNRASFPHIFNQVTILVLRTRTMSNNSTIA